MDSLRPFSSNLTLWKKAILFHWRYRADMIPFIPILMLPVWTDCYHSVLIRQLMNHHGILKPGEAVRETLAILPAFAADKLKLYIIAVLWSFLPVIGWYKGIRFRLKWAMVSNVHVFEGETIETHQKRFEKLADRILQNKRSDALILIPIALNFVLVLIILSLISVFNNSIFFWIGALMVIWISLPGSATVNTFAYLAMTDRSTLEEMEFRPQTGRPR